MKKLINIFFILVFALLHIDGSAQNLAVESFSLDQTDLTANTPGTIEYDQNGEVCALIKVETTQKGFTFDTGMLGIVRTIEKPGEIWVYVPFGLRRMTIQHPQLGILRNYNFPYPVEKARTYIMKLTSGNVRTIIEKVPTKQFLCIELDPVNSFLEIDGKMKAVENGVYQELLSFGRYNYRVSAENYHDLEGSLELKDPENPHLLKLKLKPAFGHLSVLENMQADILGAVVYVDNKLVGKVPIRNHQLSSGLHSIRIIKEMYKVYNDTFTLSDEENLVLTPMLEADYAEVTLTTDDGAEIHVNGVKKGDGNWNGKLSNGSYVFETRKDGHVPYSIEYEITSADHGSVIQIQGPTPLFGQLAISSTPVGAQIDINGVNAGNTPKYISNQVVGTYIVTVSHDGYEPQSKQVTVTEGEEASLNFALREKVQPAAQSETSYSYNSYSPSQYKSSTSSSSTKTYASNKNKKRYFGIIEAGYGYEFNASNHILGADFVNGIMLTETVGIGVGLGLIGNHHGDISMPAYFHLRSDFRNNMFASVNCGYNIQLKVYDIMFDGFFIEPSVGVGFDVGNSSRITVGLGFNMGKMTYKLFGYELQYDYINGWSEFQTFLKDDEMGYVPNIKLGFRF